MTRIAVALAVLTAVAAPSAAAAQSIIREVIREGARQGMDSIEARSRQRVRQPGAFRLTVVPAPAPQPTPVPEKPPQSGPAATEKPPAPRAEGSVP